MIRRILAFALTLRIFYDTILLQEGKRYATKAKRNGKVNPC